MKDEFCKAFCDELLVRDVPAGMAVSTAFDGLGGEPLGFYVIGPDEAGRYRLEDDGTTMPLIEAEGADLDNKTRAEAFAAMLEGYGAVYNEASGELLTPSLTQDQLPLAVMRFVALLLRLQDLVLLTPERAASTFKQDAIRAIESVLAGSDAEINEDESIAPTIEFPADLMLRVPNRDPVAIFLAATEQRLLEAVIAQMAAMYEAHTVCSVIALLDKDTSVTRKARRHAANRLTAVTYFEGDESAAITRIRREVLGPRISTVH